MDKASLLSSMEMGKWKTTEEGVVTDFSTLARIPEVGTASVGTSTCASSNAVYVDTFFVVSYGAAHSLQSSSCAIAGIWAAWGMRCR